MTTHAPHFSGVTWRFAKIIFYFLRGDPLTESTAKIIGSRCNLGNKEDLQVPCLQPTISWTKEIRGSTEKGIFKDGLTLKNFLLE